MTIRTRQIPRRAFLAGLSVSSWKPGALAAIVIWPITAALAGGPPRGKAGAARGLGDLSRADLSTFAPLLGSAFQVRSKPGRSELWQSVRAEGLPVLDQPGIHRQRDPFSLLFAGPRGPSLSQGTYCVRHRTLGDFSIFLVPVGPPGPRAYYEAVFG